jgi:IPT/TIG domain-containing protein
MRTLAIVLLVAACGGGNSGNGNIDATKSADAKVFMDAPPNVSQMITIGGTALNSTNTSTTPIAGATVKLLKISDDSVLGMATSGADGKYSFTVMTNGAVVDAYITATASGYQAAAAFPATPFQVDTTSADSNMVTTGNYSALTGFSGQHSGKGFAVVEILDAASMPVQGAVASSTPAGGSYKYMSGGIPIGTDSTDTDGTAFYVDLPPGMVTISATKTGAVFKSHAIKALPDTFTSTVITE